MHKRKYMRIPAFLLVSSGIIVATCAQAVVHPLEGISSIADPDMTFASLSVAAARTIEVDQTDQEPLKVNNKQQVQDFRLTEGDEYATLRDDVFFTTSEVVELVPDSAQSVFRPGQKVYVFAALKAPIEERVKFTWYGPTGKEILPSAYFDVEPNTGPVGFRIYSYRSFRHSGDYSVAVFNSLGKKIGEAKFTVK